MSFWSALGKIANPIGAVLGGISGAQAHNRGEKLSSQMDLEQLMLLREQQNQQQQIAREQEGRTGGRDAWQRLLSAQHTLSPGARPQLSPYSVAPRQATDMERGGADAMTAEVMARLQGGNPIPQVNQHPLEVDRKLMNPGLWERIFGYASLGLGGAGAYGKSRNAGGGNV